MNRDHITPREVIMRAISTCRADLVLEGYAPLCLRIERALAEAGFTMVLNYNKFAEPAWREQRGKRQFLIEAIRKAIDGLEGDTLRSLVVGTLEDALRDDERD